MKPGSLGLAIFVALGLAVIAIAGGITWLILTTEQPLARDFVILFAVALTALVLAALVVAWAVFHLKLVRPLSAVTREIETLSHAGQVREIDIPPDGALGDLPERLNDLIAKMVERRDERKAAIDSALHDIDTYKRRLETILLDLSEGVIVCNLDHRILLYNQASAEILHHPETLGLGRRFFGLVEREPVIDALNELTDLQRADTTQKLRVRRRIKCELRDGGDEVDMRIALICSDEVEAEGYVMTFSPQGDTEDTTGTLPPRPEFYDFDLFRRQVDREVRDIPLKELRCVVFDTETTGLNPSSGDEIISIGAVRVTNGRVVRGETFERLVNPGMKIPKPSIRFHGITDKDVKNEPGASIVFPQFHRFCGKAVMIAHNAAFDMKFLELKESAAGVRFTNSVLDILLLSAFLHDHTAEHSLAATAERLGIEVTERHSALGDAMTEAEIFLAMLDPLADRGVITLGDALDVSRKQVQIRKMQAQF